MRIVVVGAGAVGLWLGSGAQQSGHEVTWVARPPVATLLRQNGLVVQQPDGRSLHIAAANVVTRVEDAPPGQDVVLLCVKAYDVQAACQEIQRARALASHTRVVTFQNGIGSEVVAADALGEVRVIAGTLTVPLALDGKTRVHVQRRRGGVGLALLHRADQRGSALLNALRSIASWHVRTYTDWQAMKWSKLLLNLVGNASGAVLGCDVPTLLRDPLGVNVELRALREAEHVVRALGVQPVNLPGAPAAWFALALRWLPDAALRMVLRRFFARARGDKRPSLHDDVVRGSGRSEVGALNGAVVFWGQRVNVPTPVNAALSELLEQMVRGESLPLAARQQRLQQALCSSS